MCGSRVFQIRSHIHKTNFTSLLLVFYLVGKTEAWVWSGHRIAQNSVIVHRIRWYWHIPWNTTNFSLIRVPHLWIRTVFVKWSILHADWEFMQNNPNLQNQLICKPLSARLKDLAKPNTCTVNYTNMHSKNLHPINPNGYDTFQRRTYST